MYFSLFYYHWLLDSEAMGTLFVYLLVLLTATSAYVTSNRYERENPGPALDVNPQSEAFYEDLRRNRIKEAIDEILGGGRYYRYRNDVIYPHTLGNKLGSEDDFYPAAVVTDYYELGDQFKPEIQQQPSRKSDQAYITKILDLNFLLKGSKNPYIPEDTFFKSEDVFEENIRQDVGTPRYDTHKEQPFAMKPSEPNFKIEIEYNDETHTKAASTTRKQDKSSTMSDVSDLPPLPEPAELVFEDIRKQRQNPNLKPKQRPQIIDEVVKTPMFSSFSDVSIPMSLVPPNNQQLEMLRRAQAGSQSGIKIMSTRPQESIFGVALIATVALSAFLAFVTFAFGWYYWSKRAKDAADADYPAYGVTGPDLAGDRKLAHAAHMYHYQHHKQQIIALERNNGAVDDNSMSDLESDEDNVEGDYTVYECPGLATTGEMEVKNPLFSDDGAQGIVTPVLAPITVQPPASASTK